MTPLFKDKSKLLVSRAGKNPDTIHTEAEDTKLDYIENVPYFYQLHNSINPYGSCQNTSMAMVLNFYGANSYPDKISDYQGTSAAQTVYGLNSVFNIEAQYEQITARATSTEYGTISQLNTSLENGVPVIAHGYTTSYGHVIVFVGYDGEYYYANDPYGEWDGVPYSSGYINTPTAGKYVKYHKDSVIAAFAPDGYIWMHKFQ